MKKQIDNLFLHQLPAEERPQALAVQLAMRAAVRAGADISLMAGDVTVSLTPALLDILRDVVSLASCDERVRVAVLSNKDRATVNQIEKLLGLDHRQIRTVLANSNVVPLTSGRNASFSLEKALETFMEDQG